MHRITVNKSISSGHDVSTDSRVSSSDSENAKPSGMIRPANRQLNPGSEVFITQEDPSLTDPSHSDTLGVSLPPLRDAMHRSAASGKAPAPTSLNHWLASLAGTAAYSASFMIGRMAQFALTVTGNPGVAGMAFAGIAGGLNLMIEPGIATLRERLGMAADKDTAAFTNYITACCNYLECQICGDQAGMDAARKVMRTVLSDYGHGCKPIPGAPEEQQPALPEAGEQFLTMLKAFSRGWTSNEAPFFSFTVAYLLTNPAGLAARAAMVQAGSNRAEALAVELMFSLVGGLAGGTATVGLQNQLRPRVQGTGFSAAPNQIRLDKENKEVKTLTHLQLKVSHKALKDAIKARRNGDTTPVAREVAAVVASVEGILNDIRRDLPAESIALLRSELSSTLLQVPLGILEELDEGVTKELNDPNNVPYSLSRHLSDKLKFTVATRDAENRYGLDWGKTRRTFARTVGNVAGLMAYSFHLSHVMQTVAGYGPVNEPAQGNGTGFDSMQYPTSTQEAYGQVAALGASLITSWVVGRAVVSPLVEGAGAVLTGIGRRVWSGSGRQQETPPRDVAVVPGMGGVQII